jgi:SAM-dependent methyltransferase
LDEDVQTYPFEPVHVFCFSRFGNQFFENPVAGLRNMRKNLKPGGIMMMIVWRDIKDNPWLGSAKDVVLRFLPSGRAFGAKNQCGTKQPHSLESGS